MKIYQLFLLNWLLFDVFLDIDRITTGKRLERYVLYFNQENDINDIREENRIDI